MKLFNCVQTCKPKGYSVRRHSMVVMAEDLKAAEKRIKEYLAGLGYELLEDVREVDGDMITIICPTKQKT